MDDWTQINTKPGKSAIIYFQAWFCKFQKSYCIGGSTLECSIRVTWDWPSLDAKSYEIGQSNLCTMIVWETLIGDPYRP